jgi:hypothetical protein
MVPAPSLSAMAGKSQAASTFLPIALTPMTSPPSAQTDGQSVNASQPPQLPPKWVP